MNGKEELRCREETEPDHVGKDPARVAVRAHAEAGRLRLETCPAKRLERDGAKAWDGAWGEAEVVAGEAAGNQMVTRKQIWSS